MPPLIIEADTLGKKHHNINILVNEAIKKSTPFEIIQNESGNSDIENLYKIDIAAKYKNVDYILEVLKSKDMLYVSRALKHSTWLFTDSQYFDIINPQFLYSELFPYMTSKAVNKLLFYLRLHVKDEPRVDEFYKYYKENNGIMTALKWLPNCSLELIETAIEKYSMFFKTCDFKRLCEKSIRVVEVFAKHFHGYKGNYIRCASFYLNSHCKEYMKIIEDLDTYDRPYFGSKHTALILQHYPEALDKFETFANNLHTETVAKHLGKDKIKDFLIKQSKNNNLSSWFSYNNVKHFIAYLPKDGKFEFIKRVFIDKARNDGGDDIVLYEGLESCFMTAEIHQSASNVYEWYRYAPFSTAFPELKKAIRLESSADERNAILKVLITCTRRNMDHVQALLQYYHDRHINEPFRFKIYFINNVLSKIPTHRFNEKTWKILDEIYHNLEVYFDSVNDVQKCIESILVYKILHKQTIPEVIEKKITFQSFDYLKIKLDKEERELIFKYVYNLIESKLNKESLDNEKSFNNSVEFMEQMLNLLKQEDKNLTDYPALLEQIKKYNEIKNNKEWSTDLRALFNVKKSWRKLMFEESLSFGQGVDACLNALKHDPTLLVRRTNEVQKIRRDDKIDRVVSKLRVYWPQTLSAEWTIAYRTDMQEPTFSRAAARGLCLLLKPQELELLLNKHAPSNPKIQWSEIDETLLSMQRNLAQTMHYGRPQPPPNAVLQYAIGDYLQFALSSLSAIFYNLSVNETREHLPELLVGSVSRQKYGIRLAFSKLKPDELKVIFSKMWKTSKNMTIRAVVFELTFKLLEKEKNEQKITELWELLEVFIENLSADENKTIYQLLAKVDKVPRSIRSKFCMKSYKMLKSLPPKANCDNHIKSLAYSTKYLMDTIDPKFVLEIIMDHVNALYVKKNILGTANHYGFHSNMLQVISAFILHCKDETVQMKRYEDVFVPIFNYSIDIWNETHDNEYVVKNHFKNLLQTLFDDSCSVYLRSDYVTPVKLFTTIQQNLESRLSFTENYYILTFWKLNICFIESYSKIKSSLKLLSNSEADVTDENSSRRRPGQDETQLKTEMEAAMTPIFGKMCVQLLKEEVNKYFPSIQMLFAKSLNDFIRRSSDSNEETIINLSNELMADKDYIPGFLVALKILSPNVYDNKIKKIYLECRKQILSHPSVEVKMHYYKKFDDSIDDSQLFD